MGAAARPWTARLGGGSSRPFVRMPGAGFDATVAADLAPSLERRSGKAT